MPQNKPVLLLVLDGWGSGPERKENAIYSAQTPTWDNLISTSPYTEISACGEIVGLPIGQIGNSEVGHLTMGAGRTIPQDLTRIDQSIQDGSFFSKRALLDAFQTCQKNQSALHLMGLLSPGGVHSHTTHILAALKISKEFEVPVYIHAFLDGRDTPPKSAQSALQFLADQLETLPNAHLASICGRFYAMDRDNRWDRIEQSYRVITQGQAKHTAQNGIDALNNAYARQESDEFVEPTKILTTYPGLKPDDVVLFMNFRSDRARQLSQALIAESFEHFSRPVILSKKNLYTLTEYDPMLGAQVIFPKTRPANVLGEYLMQEQMTQLRIAETEKYAHVTFFFNGGKEMPFENETRILIPSPKVKTYDLQPQMNAPALTDALVEAILAKKYDVIICNYANADMVGHTGNFTATIKAIECLDQCIARLLQALDSVEGEALITADHGNADCMLEPGSQKPHTAHTLSPVPLVYYGKQNLKFKSQPGSLQDIAPTLLYILGKVPPQEMTGQSLLSN
tara:strand:+ start:77910 stop:79442 length:1533 start_codon:yes stop_codon:yes gene_type:complete